MTRRFDMSHVTAKGRKKEFKLVALLMLSSSDAGVQMLPQISPNTLISILSTLGTFFHADSQIGASESTFRIKRFLQNCRASCYVLNGKMDPRSGIS
jgi:hypothetical protein